MCVPEVVYGNAAPDLPVQKLSFSYSTYMLYVAEVEIALSLSSLSIIVTFVDVPSINSPFALFA